MKFYDQSDELKKFVSKKNENGKMAKLISVTSGKGGVGKTNFILNLAIALSIRGKKVLLIDADINLSNIDVLLGLYPEYNLTNLLDNLVDSESLLMDGPKGIKILSAASGDLEVMSNMKKYQKALIKVYKELRSKFDYILIDTGAGVSDYTVDFVINSDKILIVTTSEPTAITDAYAMMKILFYRIKSPDISLVINKVQNDKEGKKIYKKLNTILQHFLNKQVKYLTDVLYDRDIKESIKNQSAIIIQKPRSAYAACLIKAAKKIISEEI